MNEEGRASPTARVLCGVLGLSLFMGAAVSGFLWWSSGGEMQDPVSGQSTGQWALGFLGGVAFVYVAVTGRLPGWFGKGESGNRDIFRSR